MAILDDFLKEAKTIAVSGHVNPDGDCLGSTLGCYNYVKENYPQASVSIYLDSSSEVFDFLPGHAAIEELRPKERVFDLFIALDCAEEGRLGDSLRLFKNASTTICIDHHVSNPGFADHNYIEADASSASEVLYTLIDPDRVSRNTAICIYNGIVHDTGVFQYSCTGKRTMDIAGTLIEYGFDFPKLITETFYEKSYGQNRMMGKVICESELHFGGKVISGVARLEDMKKYGVTSKDMDGIVEQLRQTKGIELALFMYQIDGGWKVSMRSHGLNVSDIAVSFGGGGHERSAGCSMMKMSYEQALEKILPSIKEALDSYGND